MERLIDLLYNDLALSSMAFQFGLVGVLAAAAGLLWYAIVRANRAAPEAPSAPSPPTLRRGAAQPWGWSWASSRCWYQRIAKRAPTAARAITAGTKRRCSHSNEP